MSGREEERERDFVFACVSVCLNSHPRWAVIVLTHNNNNAHFRNSCKPSELLRNSMWNTAKILLYRIWFGLRSKVYQAINTLQNATNDTFSLSLLLSISPAGCRCDVRHATHRKFLTVWLPNHRTCYISYGHYCTTVCVGYVPNTSRALTIGVIIWLMQSILSDGRRGREPTHNY